MFWLAVLEWGLRGLSGFGLSRAGGVGWRGMRGGGGGGGGGGGFRVKGDR